MDTRKFGAYLCKLRKECDFTQSQLADMLNVTRQAVSKWEMGDSLPDISLLPQLSDIFRVTIDQILNYGESCKAENKMMLQILNGSPEKVANMLEAGELGADSIVHAAPLLKASTLGIIAEGFARHGIDIRHVSKLAAYMNEAELTHLLKKATLDTLDEQMLEQFVPFLDGASKEILFMKIINRELNASFMTVLVPYLDGKYCSLIEAAVLEGELDEQILKVMRGMA